MSPFRRSISAPTDLFLASKNSFLVVSCFLTASAPLNLVCQWFLLTVSSLIRAVRASSSSEGFGVSGGSAWAPKSVFVGGADACGSV